jgi:2-phosphoglycerate kinase
MRVRRRSSPIVDLSALRELREAIEAGDEARQERLALWASLRARGASLPQLAEASGVTKQYVARELARRGTIDDVVVPLPSDEFRLCSRCGLPAERITIYDNGLCADCLLG